MANTPQTTMRLSEADRRIIAAIERKLGMTRQTDVIRLALRRLAEAERINTEEVITTPAPPPKRRPAKK